MCEIAILTSYRTTAEEMTDAAETLYERMGSSLGILTVYDPDDKEQFEFDIYKSVNPDRDGIEAEMEAAVENNAIRVIIHARLATQGEITQENAHPLEIDCEKCDVDYVLHNGVIAGYDTMRGQYEEDHNLTTNVDSELLAHKFGDVPSEFTEDVMETDSHQPAFILVNEDRIFIRSRRYHLAEDGRMAKKARKFGPTRAEDDYGAVIITPTEAKE